MMIIGPLTFLFIFVWNIVGTAYLVAITKQSDRAKCMNTGSLVVDWLIVVIVYLFYLFVFIIAFFVCQSIAQELKKKKEVLIKLKKIYKNILKEHEELTSSQIKKMIDDITTIMKENKNSLEKLVIFKEEEQVMKLFFVPNIKNNPSRISQIKQYYKTDDLKDTILMSQENNDSNDLTEPLLMIMGKKPDQENINKQIKKIQENANEDSEEAG